YFALCVVIARGLDHRSSPSVSSVMMQATLFGAALRMMGFVRRGGGCAGIVVAQRALERLEVGWQHVVFAIFARHESAATIAGGLPGGGVGQQERDRVEHLRRGSGDNAQAFA